MNPTLQKRLYDFEAAKACYYGRRETFEKTWQHNNPVPRLEPLLSIRSEQVLSEVELLSFRQKKNDYEVGREYELNQIAEAKSELESMQVLLLEELLDLPEDTAVRVPIRHGIGSFHGDYLVRRRRDELGIFIPEVIKLK